MEEHGTEVSPSVESCPPNLEQQSEGCSPLPSSPPVKSSRAKRIKKLIMKEVIKRRGKHRRSHTCPATSQITKIDATPHQVKPTSESLHSEPSHNEELPTESSANPSIDKCDLCNSRRIECHLGTKKHVMSDQLQDEHQLDQINMLFQEIHDEETNQLPHHNKYLGRSISFQHSKEFLDALDVLSVNKQFFLRILDDPGPSLRQHYFLNQQAATGATSSCSTTTTTTTRKTLTKSGTFPSCEPSSSDNHSPDQVGEKHKSLSKEESSFKEGKDDNAGVMGQRFKDLGQKIKHLIRESRKERRRIAMDAVLHKVPVGKKVSEEDVRDSPLLPTSDQNEIVSFSPNRTKDGSESKKPLSPLHQAVAEDRYRHLLQSTSFKTVNSPERPRLRIMDETSSKCRGQKRDLRRILSSPDIQVPLAYQYDDNNHNNSGYNSSRTPNRWATCFSERKAKDVPTMSHKRENHQGSEICKTNQQEKLKNKEHIPLDDDHDDDYNNDDLGNITKDECEKALLVHNASFTCHSSVDAMQHPANESEALTDMPVHDKLQAIFACIEVAQEAADQSSWEVAPDSIQQLKVDSEDEAEFKYVKDILKISGYSGTQVLGSWESSEQPVDPSVFVEVETCSLLEPEECSPSKEGSSSNHLLLFDLINEVLLKIYERSVSYWPTPVSWSCRTHPMPKGYRVLEEVWSCINWYMGSSKPQQQLEQSSDYITTRDLSKDDGWMNLQFDAECVALEIEAIIFEDLVAELVS